MACLGFKPAGIETDVVVDAFAEREAGSGMRDLPGRMPRRTGGQLGFLEEHGLGAPAFLRQMVRKSHAHHAAAHDDDARTAGNWLLLHRNPLSTGRTPRHLERTDIPSNLMNYTNVSSTALARLTEEWNELTPEAQKVARYVLDNPQDVGVSTVREIAEAADVKPNTVVRMTRQAGFEGYEDFRAPFREAIRTGTASLPDRARWLQDISRSGELGGLYADMAGAAMRNIEETFAGVAPAAMEEAARTIWESRRVFALGVGVMNANAQNFAYLASTGMARFHAIPRQGSTPADDLAWADARDTLIAMTCNPYRSEVVEAVGIAREQGVRVIAISDSAASPIALGPQTTASSLRWTHRSSFPHPSP